MRSNFLLVTWMTETPGLHMCTSSNKREYTTHSLIPINNLGVKVWRIRFVFYKIYCSIHLRAFFIITVEPPLKWTSALIPCWQTDFFVSFRLHHQSVTNTRFMWKIFFWFFCSIRTSWEKMDQKNGIRFFTFRISFYTRVHTRRSPKTIFIVQYTYQFEKH